MGKAWGFYLLAFKKMFDYRSTAERQELNWFLLFFMLFWVLVIFLFMFCGIIPCIAAGKDPLTAFMILFVIAGIYMLVHGLALIALVKRRFKLLAPTKSNIFFGGWVSLFLIQTIACNSMYFILKNTAAHTTPPILAIILLMFIGDICALVTMGTVIYLMIKQKPIE